jgi:flagellar biogenesis protein FliO
MTTFATYIVETLLTLVAVIALAILVLVGARRVGIGRPLGPLQLVGRLPLEGRRAVYLVRVAERIFVLGASEAGLEKLGELDPNALHEVIEQSGGFRQVMARVLDHCSVSKTPGPTDREANNALSKTPR